MYLLKGFINHAAMVDNHPDRVAVFGELSAHSATYAKDKTTYVSDLAPHLTLVSFHSVRDNSHIEVPLSIRNVVFQLCNYLYERAQSGVITDDTTALWQMVVAEFAGVINGFEVGEMVTDGVIWLPERIAFQCVDVGEDNNVTLWFADSKFRTQYDEYHIEIIPPLLPLDTFFNDPDQVIQDLVNYDVVGKLDEVQAKRGEYPYTQVLAQRHNYHRPGNTGITTPSYWIVLIYGQAGNNPDLIKNALIDYILANSDREQEEWAQLLPDLFKTTEFIITPFWTQYSVPNRELQAGIYSPVLNPRKLLPLLKRTARGLGYTDAWVEQNYEFLPLLYKSLGTGVVANPDNRDGLVKIGYLFDDYMLVTNDSSDFNRMRVKTQEFITMLHRLVKVAEDYQPNSTIPIGMSRLERDGIVYIAQLFDHITYLVATRYSVEDYVEHHPLPGF